MLSTVPSFPDLAAVAGAPRAAATPRAGGAGSGDDGAAFAAALDTAEDLEASEGLAANAPVTSGAADGTTPAAETGVSAPSVWLALLGPSAAAAPPASQPAVTATEDGGGGDAGDERDDAPADDIAVVAVARVPDATLAPASAEVIAPVAPALVDVGTPGASTEGGQDGCLTASYPVAPEAAPGAAAVVSSTAAGNAPGSTTAAAGSTPPPANDDTFEIPAANGEPQKADTVLPYADAAEGRSEAAGSRGPDVTATYGRPRASALATAAPVRQAPAASAAAGSGATSGAAAHVAAARMATTATAGAMAPGPEVLAPKLSATARAATVVVPAAPLPYAHVTPAAATIEPPRLDAATGAAISAEIVQSIRLQTIASVSEATISLNPAVLGKVDIAVKVDRGAVTATVQASTPAVREWVTTHRDDLTQTLAQQGLRLERLDVAAPKDDAARDGHRDGRSPERDAPRPRREPQRDGEDFDAPFAEARTAAGAA